MFFSMRLDPDIMLEFNPNIGQETLISSAGSWGYQQAYRFVDVGAIGKRCDPEVGDLAVRRITDFR
jgi:hypothetical protein